MAKHLINSDRTVTNYNNNLEILQMNKNNNILEKYYTYKYKTEYKLLNHHTEFEFDGLYKLIMEK